MIDKKVLLEKVAGAKGDLAAAEAELELVLDTIRTQPRAEKRMVEPVLERSFNKLKHARATLAEIELSLSLFDE